MSRRSVILLCIAAALLVASWFFTTYERVTETRYTGYEGIARHNDFLAAELLLKEVGIDAESRASLSPEDWLPETADTIFTRVTPSLAVAGQRDLIIDWIYEGGHLILLPPTEETTVVDAFLVTLGYSFFAYPRDDADQDDADTDDEDDDEEYDYIVHIDKTRYRVQFDDKTHPSATISDELGYVAARSAYGEGYVTIISDAEYFTNNNIAEGDHARLLLDTIAGYISSGKVWLIYDASFTPLWELIWRNAPFVVVGSALLLITFLWSAIPTFGPRIVPDPPVRRSIIEHVNAAGRFTWGSQGEEHLALCARKALLHDAESRHPGLGRLPAEKQARLIAQITDMDPRLIFEAITSAGDRRHREFTQHMETLQAIRNKI